jgi:single-stranded-DNA-specific exonuclease
VISREGEEAFGSGRSIRSFHLLEAIESCSDLFSRYGGHAHACGFAMPAANVAELRTRLDAFARTKLTPADFDPVLDIDAELGLGEVNPELFRALELMEPYGVGNREPVFAARGVQLTAPPKTLKDKHVKLKVRMGEKSAACGESNSSCNPKSGLSGAPVAGNGRGNGLRITFDALGWNMAERIAETPLLAGDSVDIAFTIGHNDHPEYGGLELSLRDLRTPDLAKSKNDGPGR